LSFTTLTFLVFLLAVFGLHWIARGRLGQNLVVLGGSYVFYGWWDPRFCALLLGSSVIDFAIARALGQAGASDRWRRALLASSCVVNLGVLGLFKYYDFFVDSFVALLASFGLSPGVPTLHLILPVGISFYTFQTLGYTIDVYRRRTAPCSSLLDYLCYVAFFPQLVAGPIERADRLLPQLQRARSFDEGLARDGGRQIVWGMFEKLVIADHLGEFVDLVYTDGPIHARGPVLAVATVAFAFQIYCDFAGYSNIAIGTAKLFGVRLSRNFATPYFSRSIAEFWRRWHISLSTWFRDYVYVPLGGSRRGRARLWLSLMLTFTLSGLWHGANWTFVLWGAVNGLLVGLTLAGPKRARLGPDHRPPPLRSRAGLVALARMLGTFTVITATWVLFRAADLGQALTIFGRIAQDALRPSAWAELNHHREFLDGFAPLLAIFVIVEWLTQAREHPLAAVEAWPRALRWTLYTTLIWATIYLLSDEPGAFIYFQF